PLTPDPSPRRGEGRKQQSANARFWLRLPVQSCPLTTVAPGVRCAMHLAWTIPWRTLRRKACSAVTLAAYLCASVGLPMPLAAGKPGEAAFPCQMLLCGCLTPEQCADCGCFTPQQQAAWAAAHHVPAPASSAEQNKSPSCCCDGPQET